MKKTLLILREQRFRCFKERKDVSKIDNAIKLYESLVSGNKTILKSVVLKIAAEIMELNSQCSEIRLTPEEIDYLMVILFKENLV